jgi:hypothetical protein
MPHHSESILVLESRMAPLGVVREAHVTGKAGVGTVKAREMSKYGQITITHKIQRVILN